MLLVRWALAAFCLYLAFAGEAGGLFLAAGLLIVATLAASNVALARLNPSAIEGPGLNVVIAVIDAALVMGAWYLSGFESFAPVLLWLCLLNLALVGVSLGEIVAVALAAAILYAVIGQSS